MMATAVLLRSCCSSELLIGAQGLWQLSVITHRAHA